MMAKQKIKRLILPLLIVFVIVGGTVAFLTSKDLMEKAKGLLSGVMASAGSEQTAATAAPPVYQDVPELLVNLPRSAQTRYVRLAVTLALKEEGRAKVVEATPRIVDAFQTFLRSLDEHDLEGAAGLYRVRSELLRRVQAIVPQAHVEQVLVRDFVLQ